MNLVAATPIERPHRARRRPWAAPFVALLVAAMLAFGGAAFLVVHRSGDEADDHQSRPYVAEHETYEAHAGEEHAALGNSANVTMNGDTLTIVAPAGAFDRLAAGGHDLDLPPVLRMRVGQTIALRNDDRLTHILLGEVVAPGQIVHRTLTQPGIEVYAAGCAAHAAGTGMTSFIVSPASERS